MPVLRWEQVWSLNWIVRHLIINVLKVSVGIETQQTLSWLLLNSHTLSKIDWSLEVWNFKEPSVRLLVPDFSIKVFNNAIEVPGNQRIQISYGDVMNKPIELI